MQVEVKPTPQHDTLHIEASIIMSKFSLMTIYYVLSRLVLAATVWHLWQERNRRVIQQTKMHKIMLFRRLYEDILVLLQTCHWKVSSSNHEQEILRFSVTGHRNWPNLKLSDNILGY